MYLTHQLKGTHQLTGLKNQIQAWGAGAHY